MGLIRLLRAATLAVSLPLSPYIHRHVVSSYWSTATSTHTTMDATEFDFYAREIAALLGSASERKLLDYGLFPDEGVAGPTPGSWTRGVITQRVSA